MCFKSFKSSMIALLLCLSSVQILRAESPAHSGFRNLTQRPYLPPDFDSEVFDEVWKCWEEDLREQVARMSVAQRRLVSLTRYGLLPRTAQQESGLVQPLQYVVDSEGNWSMNCLACHQGEVAGRVIYGVPNTRFALASLTEDVRATKLRLGKPLARMDMGSLFMPLGNNIGTTNAVMFGVILMNYRDRDLKVLKDRPRPKMVHHDLDAPAWWHYKKKKQLYYDGFVPKDHRALMQFLLVPENGPEKFREWEKDFRAIGQWIESLQPPAYPFEIDKKLAAAGKKVFVKRCASCHGTYGDKETYPGKIISLDVVGTDPVRLRSLTPTNRRNYAQSWFGHYGRHEIDDNPKGYVAPPLDGIWATAPYLHNGSVPTLWHLFHADERPVVWRRAQRDDGYDRHRVGLAVDSFETLPGDITSLHQRRQYFDTRRNGKSAQGHLFPNKLDEADKGAVLEYLKTL